MSVTDQNGWGEVERRAQAHELAEINQGLKEAGLVMLEITVADRLKGGIISALAFLESGHTNAATEILKDCLKL